MYCTVYKISQADTSTAKYKVYCILSQQKQNVLLTLYMYENFILSSCHVQKYFFFIGNLKLLSVDIVTYYNYGWLPHFVPSKADRILWCNFLAI